MRLLALGIGLFVFGSLTQSCATARPVAVTVAAPEEKPLPFVPQKMTRPVPHAANAQPQLEPELSAKAKGYVILKCIVTTSGDVNDCRVIRSLGPDVDETVVGTVLNWRFQPATLQGKPVTVDYVFVVKFA